jgi:hypothetical protein
VRQGKLRLSESVESTPKPASDVAPADKERRRECETLDAVHPTVLLPPCCALGVRGERPPGRLHGAARRLNDGARRTVAWDGGGRGRDHRDWAGELGVPVAAPRPVLGPPMCPTRRCVPAQSGERRLKGVTLAVPVVAGTIAFFLGKKVPCRTRTPTLGLGWQPGVGWPEKPPSQAHCHLTPLRRPPTMRHTGGPPTCAATPARTSRISLARQARWGKHAGTAPLPGLPWLGTGRPRPLCRRCQ